MPQALRSEDCCVDPSDPAWDREILTTPGATIFHTSAWARVLTQTYGHNAFYHRIEKAGQPPVLFPLMEVSSPFNGRRGVCLPFTDFCAPLNFNSHGAELLGILQSLAVRRKWKHFELRGESGLPGAEPSVQFYGHELELSQNPDRLLEFFRGSVRQGIRKAERSGITVELRNDRKSMADFYSLHQRTRRRHGVPPQPWSFFAAIQREIMAKNLGFLAVAIREGKPLAASVYFHATDTAIYKFGASDFRHQDLRPNNLVMWAAIQRLCELGCHSLHFGRTSLHNEGLRRYKLAWGASEKMIRYFQFNIKENSWVKSRDRSGGLHNKLFDRLPLSMNRLAGALIYPHLD
jgi:hypothetical protein